MVDITIKTGAAWVYHNQSQDLADVLFSVDISDEADFEKELGQLQEYKKTSR